MPTNYDSEDSIWQIKTTLISNSKLYLQIFLVKIKSTLVQMVKTKIITLFNLQSYQQIEEELI